MRAAPILALLLATLAAAPAGAFEELPFRTLPGASPASCLRATGADGGLGTLGPNEDLSTPVDLLAAAGPPAVRAAPASRSSSAARRCASRALRRSPPCPTWASGPRSRWPSRCATRAAPSRGRRGSVAPR